MPSMIRRSYRRLRSSPRSYACPPCRPTTVKASAVRERRVWVVVPSIVRVTFRKDSSCRYRGYRRGDRQPIAVGDGVDGSGKRRRGADRRDYQRVCRVVVEPEKLLSPLYSM